MSELAKDRLDALKQAIAERRYDEAIQSARRLVLESGTHPEARVLLGEALLAASRNDEARVEMLALVRERPEEAAAHRLLGEAYLRDGQLEPARASLRRAVELDPDDEAARDLLLEADSEVAAPVNSTVERWLGSSEPATTEMTMPEYLEEAPAASPSASLRALLERAAPAKSAFQVPRPGAGQTMKMPAQPAPSTASVSVELEVDQEASTGSRAAPRVPAPRGDETGEISLDELEVAAAPPPRSTPPPRTGSTSPGAVAAPGAAAGRLAPPRAPAPRPSSTLAGLPSPALSSPAPAPPAPVAPAAPAAPARPRSIPPAAPPPAGVKPRSIPPAAPPPHGRAAPPSAPPPSGRSAPPPPRAPRGADADATGIHEESPTRPAVRSAAGELISPPTVITGPHAGVTPAGALLSPISADNVAITRERGAQGWEGRTATAAPARPPAQQSPWEASAPTAPGARPGLGAPGQAIPSAAPPPKLGSMGGAASPYAAPTPSPYVPRPADGGHVPTQPGAPEPITKPTLRAPGTRLETTQRVRLTQFTVAIVLSGVVAIALIVAVTRWLGARERDEVLALASDNGAEADLVHALELTEGIPGTRARLFATVTVELGQDRVEAAEAQLAAAPPGPEASVARSLLAISRGQSTEALMMLDALPASGVTLAEGARAQALALGAMGRFADAQRIAGQAWSFRPSGARHACLVAHTAALRGDAPSAESVLQGMVDADVRPCARVVRAELALARADLTAADTEANVVLGALSQRANAGESAWAHYIRARTAQARDDVATARAEHRAAAQTVPRADETLLLWSLEGLVLAGDAEAAHELSARLSPNAPNPQRRSEVLVSVALERRDYAGAETALAALPAGPRAELARARVAEARGDTTAALAAYEAAGRDAELAVDASLRRARLLSRLGRDAEARSALQQGAQSAPTDPNVVAALAHAALATDDVAAARTALTPALGAHPDEPRLLALSAVLRARDGDTRAALTVAQSAAGRATDDPEVQLDLAEVARLAGDLAVESQACTRASQLDPQRFAAVACVARAAMAAADFTTATQLLEQVRAGAPEPTMSRLRAELAVARGSGHADVDTVRGLLRTQHNDPALLVALARLQLQAEETSGADASARLVLSRSRENADALYVRAYVAYVDGHLGTAAEMLDRATQTGRTASVRARIAALRGLLAFEDRRYGNPQALADQATTIDPHCGTAHLLRALLAGRDQAAQRTALEAATNATDPPAEALARLANSLGATPRGCELAERYVRMAPDGYDRRDVDDVRSDCR